MKQAKKKEPPAAGHPAQTAPGRLSRSEITQVGRPHAGSARWRAGGSRRLRARIAGMPTKPWGQAAMSFSGSACRTRCLLEVVVLVGISLTHPAQPSQRICGVNCSHAYLLTVRRTPTPVGSTRHLGSHAPIHGPPPSSYQAIRDQRSAARRTSRPSSPPAPAAPGPRGIRFGNTPTIPLHSCIGVRATRRLSSVGRASHS